MYLDKSVKRDIFYCYMSDIQRILNAQNKNPKNFQKLQDKQYEEFRKAQELAEESKTDKAIEILEKIFYKDGYVGRGAWPLMLPNIYMKNKMYDKCWKYLNFISAKKIGRQDIIRDLQAKIHKAENRPLDALLAKMACLLLRHVYYKYEPPLEEVDRKLKAYIKKANLNDNKNYLMELYSKYIKYDIFDEIAFTDEFKKIVKKNTSED